MSSPVKELEERLVEVGKSLIAPPSDVDELLPLLDKAELLLSRVEQSPSKSMSAALHPGMKGLVAKELLGHLDEDVKVAVASCISEITRITAPKAPYDDNILKDIFQKIVNVFEKLDDMSSRSQSKRVSILETFAKFRSCVVMLDLECDALVLEMFHHFLRTIRDSHPPNVFSSMQVIMTLVLEESDDISPELVSTLLMHVKKNAKDVLPVARRLAEKVIGNCAIKLKPHLMEVVQSSGGRLSDYSKIISTLCKESSHVLENNGLNDSGECLSDRETAIGRLSTLLDTITRELDEARHAALALRSEEHEEVRAGAGASSSTRPWSHSDLEARLKAATDRADRAEASLAERDEELRQALQRVSQEEELRQKITREEESRRQAEGDEVFKLRQRLKEVEDCAERFKLEMTEQRGRVGGLEMALDWLGRHLHPTRS